MFVYTAFLALNSLSLVIRMPFYPPATRSVVFHMGDFSPAFRGSKEGQSDLFALAVSQVPLIQNNMPQCLIWGDIL